MVNTQQEGAWSGKFGKEYTDRNMMSPDEVDRLYVDNYGISRTALNKEFRHFSQFREKPSYLLGIEAKILTET